MRSFRFPVSAAMLLVAAGGVVAAAACHLERSPDRARSVSRDQLEWRALKLEGHPVADASRPAVLLYIAPSCAHCEAAALAFQEETSRTGVRALIVSAEDEQSTRNYQLRLGLPPMAVDSARGFGKAAGIRWVPTLVTFSGKGDATVRLVPSADLIPRYLAQAR